MEQHFFALREVDRDRLQLYNRKTISNFPPVLKFEDVVVGHYELSLLLEPELVELNNYLCDFNLG